MMILNKSSTNLPSLFRWMEIHGNGVCHYDEM